MAEITSIKITKNPGYGCSSTMFQEKIKLTAHAIEYKLIPHMHNKRDAESYWKYQSDGEYFRDLVKEAFDELGKLVLLDDNKDCCDIGSMEFVITYSDKTKFKKTFWRPPTDFSSGLMVIRNLVPHTEQMPRFLECL